MKIHDRKICENCSKRDPNGLCYIKATTRPPSAPMCEYGLKISASDGFAGGGEMKPSSRQDLRTNPLLEDEASDRHSGILPSDNRKEGHA